MASSKAVRCWGEAEIRRSTSSVSSDCAPWALSDPTWQEQRPGSGVWPEGLEQEAREGLELEARERSPTPTLAQNPTESMGEKCGVLSATSQPCVTKTRR